jgi:hypothetical protein
MSRLRLQDADRERFGCPELLPVDLSTVTNREAITLRGLGFPTPRLLVQALQADDHPLEYEAWTGFVWLALRRSGIKVEPAELEFAMPVTVLRDEEPPEPVVEGKAEEVPAASTT